VLSPDDTPTGQLTELADVLRLPAHCEEQDWGVELADPQRLVGFIEVFETHHDDGWSPWTVAEYFDLVLQSANDAWTRQEMDKSRELGRFVARAQELAPDRIAYWSSLSDTTEHCRDEARTCGRCGGL
jgi:hypothetical protein